MDLGSVMGAMPLSRMVKSYLSSFAAARKREGELMVHIRRVDFQDQGQSEIQEDC